MEEDCHMESSAAAAGKPVESQAGEGGLKKNAIGYISNVVIGVASTAPGYSIAATLGFVVAVSGVGLAAPAVMLVAFLPMFCIAYAYRYMNKADPDCGTTFSWATRGLGPSMGWLGGWAIIATDVIVMASLAQIAAIYSFLLFDWTTAADSQLAVMLVGVAWIVVMTAICYLGTELSARTQQWLLGIEIFALTLFAIWALAKVYISDPPGSLHVQAAWFSPFSVDSFGALIDGVLLGTFIYWGWDSGVAVNEESEDPANGPGKAAIVSTLLLLGIYLIVSAAAQAYGGPELLIDNADDVLSVLGDQVFPSPLDKLLIITVLTSASASTQTTILPTARATLSMARQKAFPPSFGKIHPRHLTPSYSTVWMGAVSTAWFIGIELLSPDNVLGDSVTALGFGIAFYYGITGIACAVFYRRELLKDWKTFVYAGLLPVVGAIALFGIFIVALKDYSNPDNTNTAILGIGSPVVIGVGALLLGAVVMFFARFRYKEFFARKPEVFDPATAGQAIVPEEAI
jgi:amino acid transporter